MTARLPKPLVAVLLAALSLAIAPAAASAANAPIVVDTTADGANTSSGDTACVSGKAGCTLRAAVQMANATAGADTIILHANTDPYALSVSGSDTGGSPNAAVGDLDITGDVTITGDGQDTTKIDASALGDRVFDVQSSATATVSGVTITGGHANSGDVVTGSLVSGGGIRVLGTLTLTDSTLSNNIANIGGGAATDAPGASMTLLRDTITGNGSGVSTQGGGVAEVDGGTVTIDHSTVSDNHGTFGVGVDENGGGTVTVTDSLVADNVATSDSAATRQAGGGTEAGGLVETGGGTLTLTRTEVRGNQAGLGGGVTEDGAGTVNVSDSWIHDNKATGPDAGGGGILADAAGKVTISRSTVNANSAVNEGGGLLDLSGRNATGATWAIANSTFSGNSAGSGGAIGLEGSRGGRMTIDSSTLHDNVATRMGAIAEIDNCFATGSECSGRSENVTVHATIVGSSSPACGGLLTSLGVNLGSDDTCSFHAAGDKINTDPKLGPLAANGGPTMTMALLSGSPAIDAAGTAGCQSTDQRGIARPQGPACDIGAFEAEVPKPASSPSIVTPSKKLKSCVSRRNFRIRVRRRHGVKIVSATIRVNGHKVRVLTGKRLRAPVDLRKLPKGTFTVSITARTSRGRILRAHRTYHTCIPRLPRGRLPAL